MKQTALLHFKKAQWSAMRMLSAHELLGESYWDEGCGARWCIGEPSTFIGKTEIIAGIGTSSPPVHANGMASAGVMESRSGLNMASKPRVGRDEIPCRRPTT